MRPTFSIIVFTVLSGAGYGLLFLLGLLVAAAGMPAQHEVIAFDGFHFGAPATTSLLLDPRTGLALFLAIGTALVSLGLLASVAHLGKPLRAWRAFSQWRSSWLSREGVVSLLTYVPIGALAWLLFARDPAAGTSGLVRICGLLLALCSAATVFCTVHIYSSLKPVRAWHDGHVLYAYFLLGLYSGALWLVALDWLPISGAGRADTGNIVWLVNAIVLGPACAWIKSRYWRCLDSMPAGPSAGAATGLDRLGTVRSFEQPHTEENYLTHEMGFVLARKHSRRLHSIAFWLILLAPATMLPTGWLIGWPAAWFALLLGMLGIFVERWLFFAEAKHAVMAYYAR